MNHAAWARGWINSVAVAGCAAAGASCAPAAKPATTTAADPGYECIIKDERAGTLHLFRRLDANGGTPSDAMTWRFGAYPSDEPEIGASWASGLPQGLDVPGGWVTLDWSGGPAVSRAARMKLRLAVTTSLPGPGAPEPIIRQDEKNAYAGVYVSWADMSALAAGAKDLFFLLRDRRGVVVHHARVDPAIFVAANAAIADALRRMPGVAADYRSGCERIEPSTGGEIVVH